MLIVLKEKAKLVELVIVHYKARLIQGLSPPFKVTVNETRGVPKIIVDIYNITTYFGLQTNTL